MRESFGALFMSLRPHDGIEYFMLSFLYSLHESGSEEIDLPDNVIASKSETNRTRKVIGRNFDFNY